MFSKTPLNFCPLEQIIKIIISNINNIDDLTWMFMYYWEALHRSKGSQNVSYSLKAPKEIHIKKKNSVCLSSGFAEEEPKKANKLRRC